jgi:hypothetical protein
MLVGHEPLMTCVMQYFLNDALSIFNDYHVYFKESEKFTSGWIYQLHHLYVYV